MCRDTHDHGHRLRDQGMTMPEILITITVAGIILSVIASAIIVTLRNAAVAEGRVNLAADEQSIEYDLPTDLASASYVDTDPSLSPCGTACPADVTLGGSNALFLTWSTDRAGAGSSVDSVTTNVSYYFRPNDDGEYQLDRIECEAVGTDGWSCATRTVLRRLPGPPGGVFLPGDTVPNWVIQVSEPLAPGAVALDQFADSSTRKDANRVVVTIHGNGGPSGEAGGSRDVSITAGGTTRGTLTPESVDNSPGFVELPGRCGGTVSLIVDNSELVRLDKKAKKEKAKQVDELRSGVRAFIEALAGTPTRLQIVTYDDTSRVLDPDGGPEVWTRYVDMTDRVEVSALHALVDGAITATGGANWEDGWFRTFFRADSTAQDEIPALTVFFTAGFPNSERLRDRSPLGTLIDGIPPHPGPGWPMYDADGDDDDGGAYYSNGDDYSQVAFDRAEWFADRVRASTRLISIGVEKDKVEWTSAGRRYDYEFQRGWRRYQRASRIYEYWHRYYQHFENGKWSKVKDLEYYLNNTTEDESDGWRVRPDSDKGWEEKSESKYLENNITDDESDFWRVGWDDSSWEWVTEAEYLANNTTGDESDGYRDAGFEWVDDDDDAMDWTAVAEGATGGGYRWNKVYRPDGEYVEESDHDDIKTVTLLSRLITGTDHPVKGDWDKKDDAYTNGAVADVYEIKDKDWDRVPAAMRSAALSGCGGTVTVSTRVNDTYRADDEFTFQTTALADHKGKPLTVEPATVTTNAAYPARSFLFDPPNDKDQWVTIVPGDLSSATGYAPAATPWTCWSGLAQLGDDDMRAVEIDGEPWAGVEVRINAGRSLSCELNVVEL